MAARSPARLSLLVVLALLAALTVKAADFDDKFDVIGERDHIGYKDDGAGGLEFSLALNNESGSGFKSKDKYLFGEFSVRMKLVDGNSAGTVTSFYVSRPTTSPPISSFFSFEKGTLISVLFWMCSADVRGEQ
jgi:xyloglucan:xyloglucosyl transferase